jgi:hypothetical protein
MKKPRSDAKLLSQLTEEQQAKLSDWLLSGVPYHEAKELVKKEFAVSTSLGALSGFWDVYCSAALIRRRQRAVSTADAVAEEAASAPGKWDAATIDALKQQAFELAISPGADPKNVQRLFSLVLKSRDQELAERQLEQRIREYEEKNAKAKAVLEGVKSKGGLTAETLKEIEEASRML